MSARGYTPIAKNIILRSVATVFMFAMSSARMPPVEGRSVELLLPATTIKRRAPANLIEADDVLFRDHYEYSTFDTFLKRVGRARVSAESVVYKMYAPITDTLYTEDNLGYYRTRYLAKKLLKARKVRLEKGTNYLLATDQESHGHFHWLTEALPRLWLVRNFASDFVLMLPETPYTTTVCRASLERAGLSFRDILWMKPDDFYSVPNLYVVSKVALTGQMHDGVMRELRQALVGERPAGKRKLYIGRQRANFRKVLNRQEVIDRLRRYDVEPIHPMDMSFSEQVEAFSECGTLIGLHGAGLTNCLFMQRGGKVVELRKREPNYGYWHLASSIGHEYYYYHGVPDSELSLIGRGCNLTIPVDDFEDRILKKL